MSGYPIPVENFDGDKALTIICETCRGEAVIDADEILTEGLYRCPRGCGGTAVMKYEVADRCKGCGKLGWFSGGPSGCCSRACALQAEYAAMLAEQRS